MSFLDNTKNAGLALTVIGIVMIVGALLDVYDGVTAEGDLFLKIGLIFAAIGAIIAAVAYFKYGNSVRKGRVSGKFDVLTKYVSIVGYTTGVIGVFMVIGGVIQVLGEVAFDQSGIVDGIIKIVFAIVIAWVAAKITDNKKSTFDKIMWIVLTVVFVILFLSSFLAIFQADIIAIIVNICYALVYIMMLVFMFDGDVKNKFGM